MKDGTPVLLFREDSDLPNALLRAPYDDFGLVACDLVAPPRRFWSDGAQAPPVVDASHDLRRLRQGATPAQLLNAGTPEQPWPTQTRRSLARLRGFFMVCEDPQRRLDAREVNTLAHQVSLVRHVLENAELHRVLIADEVGLGKTVETGLIIAELLEGNPGLRALYLAPARLVRNVRRELDRLKLNFRQWTSVDRDAVLQDSRVVASIHKAVCGSNFNAVVNSGPWDVLVVDECHHLSDWAPGGGDPTENFRLVRQLIERLGPDGRVIFLSGTPHQGHLARFENLVKLLKAPGEDDSALAGRVIYRTKDDVRDWNGAPLFPRRQVNDPILFEPGEGYRAWIQHIYDFYHPSVNAASRDAQRRAAGWRCAQALQWAASSPQAGLGYLVRQALRAGWRLDTANLQDALSALRPYRGGTADEPAGELYGRMLQEIGEQTESDELEDLEDYDTADGVLRGNAIRDLEVLLGEGLMVLREAGDGKWDLLKARLLDRAAPEKVVLFAQPIETVTALASYLQRTYGETPALIIGGQSDEQRQAQIDLFWRADGPRFLVSSRAGGEGINLQIARRLVHIDVPWNPMELEQRVGRVHRFGSRQTIIVDTLVAKGSREEEAYRVARQKLALIVGTMVEPERFESVFSRVMALVGQEDIQQLMLGGPTAPMNRQDQDRLAALIRQGFTVWSDFHDRFAAEQQRIKELDPGLAAWEDLDAFLQEYAEARAVAGFCAQRFAFNEANVDSVLEPARVITFDGSTFFACGDYSGAPVFGPEQEMAQAIGLNSSPVTQALRRIAFPPEESGAAHVRWPAGKPLPFDVPFPFGVIVLLKQTLRSEQGSWSEVSSSLHCSLIPREGSVTSIENGDRALLLRGLFRASIRSKPEEDRALSERVLAEEIALTASLRRLDPDDGERRIRHAAMPLFAAIVSAPA
jgi:SNF2 family DNA or RNA helicase